MAVVDEKRNFIFIHIYKTAGNSVRRALEMGTDGFIGAHVDMKDVRNALIKQGKQEFFDNAYKFSFVRNPYDWMVSLYHHMKAFGEGPKQAPVKEQNMSFSEGIRYIGGLINQEKVPGTNKYQRQLDFFTDDEVEGLLVDKVYRFEALEDSIKNICTVLHTPYKGVPVVNKSATRKQRHYKEYYNQEDKEYVFDLLEKDFNFFGYSF